MNNNEVKIFENEEFGKVRTVEVNGEPYFVARDVATILGYSNPNEAIGKKRAVISLKINNKRVMYLDEAEKIAELLEIKESDFGTYFFYHPVA